MEIRVYYESLEQCLHYLVEDIKEIFPNDEIVIIKKTQQSFGRNGFSKRYSKNISKILIRKNPDLVISIINNGIEYVICVVEFSTAVYTKDHEQQRSDNFLLPIKNPLFYIKVSSTTKDSGQHGGDTRYNPIEPFSLCYKKYGKLCFHIEWDSDPKDSKYVLKHEHYKSIPKSNKEFISLVELIIKCFQTHGLFKYENEVKKEVLKIDYFKDWINKLSDYNDFEDISAINSTRTEWKNVHSKLGKKNVFILKINRMGHAMDPERGMLTHYSTFFRTPDTYFLAKIIFDINSRTWFKSTSAESYIDNELSKITHIGKPQLIDFLSQGLSLPNSAVLNNIVNNSEKEIIDISNYVSENFNLFNTSFRTIIEHSNCLNVTNGLKEEIYLTWDNVKADFNFFDLPIVTEIKKRELLTEDDVTYITMNSVFKLNGISPISVSYPGAQSDTPILTQPGRGRRQERIYIDSIGEKNNSLFLQENGFLRTL